MTQHDLFEITIHYVRAQSLLPPEAAIESTFELVMGCSIGESSLSTKSENTSPKTRDLRGLTSIYSSHRPLSAILCHDRDLLCFLDNSQTELVIEATAGYERRLVIAGEEYIQHADLGSAEGSRISFAGLKPGNRFLIALIPLHSAEAVFEEAERLFETEGSSMEVLTQVERALMLNPRHCRAWRRKAYVLRDLNRRDEGLSAVEQALSIDPDFALGWRCKGAILRDLGKDQEGLDCYLRSLALDPTDAICWTNKGNALCALGRQQEAEEAYAEARRIGELYPERH